MALHTRFTGSVARACALCLVVITACGSETPGTESNGLGAGSGGTGGSGGTAGVNAGTGGTAGVMPLAGTGGAAGTAGAASDAGAGTGGVAGSGTDGGGLPASDSGPGGPTLPPVDDPGALGPFATTTDQNTGPGGTAWVVRPSELGADGLEHPIFVWGPGAGTGPAQYTDHLEHWASHGFLVYSVVSTGDGSEMVAAIDWLVAENGKAGGPYFEKLDVTKIAAGGHSRGSLSTFGMADDPRLTTTIHVAGGSFDGNGFAKLLVPAAYICGEADTLATPNCERDYGATTVPVFFTVMAGVSHVDAARSGLPAITAWLRWHLAGEGARRAMFLDPGGAFTMGSWVSMSKNW